MATELYREAISVPFMSRFIVYAKRHDLNEAKLRVYCITDDKEEKTLELRENFMLVAKSKEVEILENRTQWLEMGGNIAPVTGANKATAGGEQLSLQFNSFVENRLPFVVRVRDLEQQPPAGRLVFLKDPKNAAIKSDVRAPPVCTLDIQLPSFNRELIEHDEMRKKNVIENGLQFTFLNGSGTLTTTLAKSSTNLLCNQAAGDGPGRVEFNFRLLANDLNNSDKPFDWTQLAAKLDLTNDEIESVKHMSSSSPLLLSSSPANQTFDMLTAWNNKFITSLDYSLQLDAHAQPGDLLLKALRELAIDEEIINRNITSNFTSQATASPTSAAQVASTAAENVYSVEKSLAKLNLNLESPSAAASAHRFEDRDIIKDPESDESHPSEEARMVDQVRVQHSGAAFATVTITAEEHVRHEPNSITHQTIISTTVSSRDGQHDVVRQHIEGKLEFRLN